MTVRAPGARISLICLFVVAARGRRHPRRKPFSSGDPAVTADPGRTTLVRRQPRARPTSCAWRAPRQAACRGAVGRRVERPWWGWLLLGRLHPMVVHFPIALLTVTALVELLHIVRRRPVPSEAGTYCLAFGVAGALVAVCLGTLNAGAPVGDRRGSGGSGKASGDGLDFDDRGSVRVGNRAGGAARAPGSRPWRCTSASCWPPSAVVSATGHLGGGLVYGEDYLTGVLPWNQRRPPFRRRR